MAKKESRKALTNKVYSLKKAVKEELNKRLLAKEFTLVQLLDFVNNHPENNGIEISKSGLNRYAKSFDKQMKDLQDLEALLSKLPKDMDFSQESGVYTMVAKILATKVYEKSVAEDIEVKDLLMLSRSLKDILSSVKDREKIKVELRKEVEKELKTKQAQELTKAKNTKQISKKSFDEAMRILGL